jgi:methionine synthase II (cobalamin-independent)
MTSLAGASACAAAACRLRQPFLVRDWQIAQSATRKVKITVPGPLTIGDSVADDFYREPRSRGAALADALSV